MTLWTVAPLSMRFPRQEYWSGVPFPTSGDTPKSGIIPVSPESFALAGGFFTTERPGKPPYHNIYIPVCYHFDNELMRKSE